jgi:hypothetical protein
MTVTSAPISVTAILDEHVAALSEERLPDGKWHPSSYWGCDRKVVYELRGVEKTNPPNAATYRRFRVGHILHEFVQGALATAPEIIAFYPEFSIETKLEETGHGDGLAFLNDGTAIVLEFKSINARGFGFLKTGPKDDHAKQASSYAVAARRDGVIADDGTAIPPLGDKLTGVLVVYLEKDSLEMREFWLPYNTGWEARVEARIASLERYRADPESLPPRQADKSKFPCSWKGGQCDFLDRCWDQDGNGVRPTEATAVPDAFEW